MKKQYLTEYLISNNVKFKSGVINLINAPCGSGKTTFIFSDEGIINNYRKFTDSKYNIRPDQVLYVVDTSMLKDNILKKYKNITKQIETKDFNKRLVDDGVTVLTYAQLGTILCSDEKIELINTYKLIIFDEFHNLFVYNNKFSNIEYKKIISSLKLFAEKSILLALTATPYYIDKLWNNKTIKINNIIEDCSKLKKYSEDIIIKDFYPVNYIKQQLIINKMSKSKRKILIYTENISVIKKYKELCDLNGIKAEMLWSINSKQELNENQIKLRERLIEQETLPDEVDVLILNASYQTGWNLKDKNIQTVIVDSTNITIQEQVRNRCRHDIHKLIVRSKKDDCFNNKNYKGILYNNIDSKYINKKLTSKDKKELTLLYTYKDKDKEPSFIDFKKQINELSDAYRVETTNKGIYIRMKNDKKDNTYLLKDYLINKWNKSAVSITGVRDKLKLSRRIYDKIIKDDTFNEWLKINNIIITTIKGKRRTLYYKIA